MKYSLNRVHQKTVERSIQPMMAMAVTLPVLCEGADTGVVVYVAVDAFAAMGGQASPETMRRRLLETVRRITIQ